MSDISADRGVKVFDREGRSSTEGEGLWQRGEGLHKCIPHPERQVGTFLIHEFPTFGQLPPEKASRIPKTPLWKNNTPSHDHSQPLRSSLSVFWVKNTTFYKLMAVQVCCQSVIICIVMSAVRSQCWRNFWMFSHNWIGLFAFHSVFFSGDQLIGGKFFFCLDQQVCFLWVHTAGIPWGSASYSIDFRFCGMWL